jgi:tryptophan synthase alpha chain
MNRIKELFSTKNEKVLNIYFTAGFPKIEDTLPILQAIQNSGANIAEIGMPYSDPVADGETIQVSNHIALNNGMSLKLLFEQLQNMRQTVKIPVILMGYINPVMQFGVEEFCKKCQEVGVDGLILPDLPLNEYVQEFKPIFEKYGILNIFLITPQTSPERIVQIDQNSEGFIYMVSSASITGSTTGITDSMIQYFERINSLKLRNPRLIGFGIQDHETFSKASEYAQGAIIGSAFIRVLQDSKDLETDINTYIQKVLQG